MISYNIIKELIENFIILFILNKKGLVSTIARKYISLKKSLDYDLINQ